nr:NAD-dependent epimerase/dehydratase family protein [Mycobacterium sp. E2479]
MASAGPRGSGRLNVFRGAQCVIHLAWGFQPTANRRYLDAVAVDGSAAVLSAAHNAKVPQLVHMSSAGTYAAGRYAEQVDESWSTAGIRSSAYSRAKSTVEHMLDDYERHNPDGVGITRMRPGFMQRDAAPGLRRSPCPCTWIRNGCAGCPCSRWTARYVCPSCTPTMSPTPV